VGATELQRRKPKELRANTAWSMSARAASIVTALVLSPYIVHRVGLRVFGFWAIVSALAQYMSLLDFGFSGAVIRYVASLEESGDEQRLRRVVATGFYSLALIGLVAVSIAALVVWWLPAGLTRSWPHGWRISVLVCAACFAVSVLGTALMAIPAGMHRWDVQAGAAVAAQAGGAITTVVLLDRGEGLIGLSAGMAAASVISLAAGCFACLRFLGRLPHPGEVTREEWRELLRYGANMQVANLAVVVNAQSDKFVLLLFAPLSWIGLYELGARVAFSLRSLVVAAFGPMVAAAARAGSSNDREHIRGFYERTLGSTLVYGVAPLVVAYAASYPLVIAWLGGRFETSALIAMTLGIGYAVNAVTGAGTSVARGCGRPQLDRNYSLVGLGLNLALTVVLGLAAGPWGVVIATALALVVSSAWFMHTVDEWLGSAVGWDWVRSHAGAELSAALTLGLACVAAELVVGSGSRVIALGIGGGTCLLAASAFGLAGPWRFSLRRVASLRSSA
jgi:O-antigen/teichoic acid export membrane protein